MLLRRFWFFLFVLARDESNDDPISTDETVREVERRNKNNDRNYKATAEITQGISFHTVVRESLPVPSTITFLDPAILFLNCYTFLTYGIRYSFLEAFPIVYQGMYGFNLGEMGAAFLAIVVGTIIFIIYNIYLQNQRPKNQIPKSSHQARNHTNPHAIRLPPPSSLHRPIPIRLDRTPRNLPDRAGNRNRHLPRLRAYSDAMCFCTCRDVIRSMRRMCSRRRTLREVR